MSFLASLLRLSSTVYHYNHSLTYTLNSFAPLFMVKNKQTKMNSQNYSKVKPLLTSFCMWKKMDPRKNFKPAKELEVKPNYWHGLIHYHSW